MCPFYNLLSVLFKAICKESCNSGGVFVQIGGGRKMIKNLLLGISSVLIAYLVIFIICWYLSDWKHIYIPLDVSTYCQVIRYRITVLVYFFKSCICHIVLHDLSTLLSLQMLLSPRSHNHLSIVSVFPYQWEVLNNHM